MNTVKRTIALGLVAASVGLSVPALAQHHGGTGFRNGGFHHHSGAAFGLGVGLGLALGYPYYYNSYPYPSRYYYYDYPAYTYYDAPSYRTVWYWCAPAQAYYPNVTYCPQPWIPVRY